MRRIGRLGVTMMAAALAFTACGGDDAVSVSGVWARVTAPGQGQGAIYFDLVAADDDRLVGASVPGSVAAGAEIHEAVVDDGTSGASGAITSEVDDTSMEEGSHDMGDGLSESTGIVRMREMVDGLTLEAGETVRFEPGGHHIMLPGLAEPLVADDRFELTLEFADAPDVTVTVTVAEAAL